MPFFTVDIQTFLSMAKAFPVMDVRSPAEYAHAHIPGAYSLPIFTNEQRKEIGTTYKQISRQDAITIGLKYFGAEMNEHIQKVEKIVGSKERKILIHCWRGGMRSAAMAWLMDFYGFEVYLLKGGYKAYRNYVIQQLEQPFQFKVLGGYTGSGKTEVLHELAKLNHQVIDLEGLASHKGSAFGSLGMGEQPSQEYFENKLFHELTKYCTFNQDSAFSQQAPIWLENESQRIGMVNIPNAFYQTMRSAPAFKLILPFEKRLDFIHQHYGQFEREKLVNAIIRIQKRLGGLDTKNAINFLLENNVKESFRILLSYYDKFYKLTAANDNTPQVMIESDEVDAIKNAKLIAQTLSSN